MKEDADKQLAEITVSQVKELLRKKLPIQFDQMIISDDQVIKRDNYVYVKLERKTVERKVKKLSIPLFDNITSEFAKFEGGVEKFGDKAYVPSMGILNKNKAYSFSPPPEAFVFPLEVKGDELAIKQSHYFYPKYTYQETCNKCNGERYITCNDSDCCGKHNWVCPTCVGQRRVVCRPCGGAGKVPCSKCDGAKNVTCSQCRGNGGKYISGGNYASGAKKPNVWQQCSGCRGRGEVTCSRCSGQGTTICTTCEGDGKVTCSHCEGQGDITCSKCYGDKAKYGLIDCPTCDTAAKMGHIVYCETIITNNKEEQLLKIDSSGGKEDVGMHKMDMYLYDEEMLDQYFCEEAVKRHIPKKPIQTLVFKSINEMVVDKYDKYCKLYLDKLQKARANDYNFPRVVEENLFYKVIPRIQISCSHLLTKKEYSVNICDFWDNPEISVIEPGEDNSLRESLTNSTKVVGSFFTKLFKTKEFKIKEDRKKAVKLMIYVSRADGAIAEQEKQMLINQITDFDQFTKSEREVFLDLLNQKRLPQLTPEDYNFSSEECASEIAEMLIKLAYVDGVMHPKEMAIIELITKKDKSSIVSVQKEIPASYSAATLNSALTPLISSPDIETSTDDEPQQITKSLQQLKNTIMDNNDKETIINSVLASKSNTETVFVLQSHYEEIRVAVINRYFKESMMEIAAEFDLSFACSDDFESGTKGSNFNFQSTQWSKCNIKFIFDKANFQHMYWCIYADQSLSGGKQMKLDIFSDSPAAAYPYGWSWFEYKDWNPNTYIDIVNGTLAKLIKEKVQLILDYIKTTPEIEL